MKNILQFRENGAVKINQSKRGGAAIATNLNSSKASDEFSIPLHKGGGMTSENFFQVPSDHSPLKINENPMDKKYLIEQHNSIQ